MENAAFVLILSSLMCNPIDVGLTTACLLTYSHRTCAFCLQLSWWPKYLSVSLIPSQIYMISCFVFYLSASWSPIIIQKWTTDNNDNWMLQATSEASNPCATKQTKNCYQNNITLKRCLGCIWAKPREKQQPHKLARTFHMQHGHYAMWHDKFHVTYP